VRCHVFFVFFVLGAKTAIKPKKTIVGQEVLRTEKNYSYA